MLSDNILTLNAFRHSAAIKFDPVLNNFINDLVNKKSKECLSLEFTGHASRPNKMTGKHLD